MIEYDKFQMSLARLEEQHANYRNPDASLPDLTQEAIAESVIQRFETCYDCLWKVLKRYLIEELGIADAFNSPKPTFRLPMRTICFPRRWNNGCVMPPPASIPLTTTMAQRRKPAWNSYRISSTTPSASTRP